MLTLSVLCYEDLIYERSREQGRDEGEEYVQKIQGEKNVDMCTLMNLLKNSVSALFLHGHTSLKVPLRRMESCSLRYP